MGMQMPGSDGVDAPSLSVVVPAHQEESSVARCLTSLLQGTVPGELDIVVVCNGCTDRTVEVAAAFAPAVRVIETPMPSKPNALNLGDAHVVAFPRAYVDADVEITGDELRKLRSAVVQGGALVAVPAIRVELEGRSWLVRSFFAVWTQLPFFREGMASSGVYVVSAVGRRRFADFPDLMADDHFVLSRFTAQERRFVPEAVSVVQAPRSVFDIVRIKTRAFVAERQLVAFGERSTRQHGGRFGWVRVVAGSPRLWPAVPVYLLVNLAAELRARGRVRRGDLSWERDVSSRVDSGC